jgi:hypothetical protein
MQIGAGWGPSLGTLKVADGAKAIFAGPHQAVLATSISLDGSAQIGPWRQ